MILFNNSNHHELQQMFKKTLKVGGQSQLSGKDKKNLKTALMKQFNEEDVDHLFNKTEKILCQKLTTSKMLIYRDEDDPLFIDSTGKNDMFPSLYTLMAYPDIIPSVQILEGVQENLYKGTNLMWTGVSDYSDLQDFQKDNVVGVRNSKGNFVAIGAMFLDKKELNEETKSGVCLEVLTHLNDKLWEHGSKIAPPPSLEKPKQKVEQKPEIVQKPIKKVEEAEEKKADKKKQGKGNKGKEKEDEDDFRKEKEDNKGSKGNKEEKEKQKQKGNKKKGKKQQSDQSQPEIAAPSKIKATEKKEQKKKAKKQESDDSPDEVPVPQVKEQQVKKPVNKQQKNPQPKEESESESDEDLTSLIHQKKNVQPVKKVETKHQNVFSDEQDDKKKKKHTKKPTQPVKKDEPNKQKKEAEESNKEESEDDFRKAKKKDNKKKKDTKDVKKEEEQKKKKEKEHQRKKRKESSQVSQEEEEQTATKIKPELMDECLKQALLNGIKLGLRDQDLPIDSNQFFTDYVQLGRREGVHLDIKASSYGKINKFFEAMTKEGIIEFKQGKQKSGTPGATINKVNRDHEELKDYVPTIKKMGKRQIEEEKDQKHDANLKFQVSKTLQVEEVYRPKIMVQDLFGVKLEYQEKKQKEERQEQEKEEEGKEKKKKVIINKNDFFALEECKEKISAYLEKFQPEDEKKDKKKQKRDKEKEKQKQKQKKDKGEKTLYLNYENDDFLRELLKDQIEEHEEQLKRSLEETQFKQEDNEEGIPEEIEDKSQDKKRKKQEKRRFLKIDREEFERQILKHMETFHKLVDKPNNVLQFKEGKFKGVQIIAEKANNKNVTRINSIQLITIPKNKMDQQISNLVNLLQQRLASSVTVHHLPGKNAGKEITIQGTFLDELVDFFIEEHSVNKDLIAQVNKLDKKKKN